MFIEKSYRLLLSSVRAAYMMLTGKQNASSILGVLIILKFGQFVLLASRVSRNLIFLRV